jgi:CheY-like chemotaxis protein
MINNVKCIMLIDDNKIDNFFHERVIKKSNAAEVVIATESGQEALEYLNSHNEILPNIIILDINMPGMNGWEFIEHYKKTGHNNKAFIIVMLPASALPDQNMLEHTKGVTAEFRSKPLTKEMLSETIAKYHLLYPAAYDVKGLIY